MGRKGRDSSESSESDRRAKVVPAFLRCENRLGSVLSWIRRKEKKTRKDDKRKDLPCCCLSCWAMQSILAGAWSQPRSQQREAQGTFGRAEATPKAWPRLGQQLGIKLQCCQCCSRLRDLQSGSESEDSESKSSDDEEARDT